MAHTRDANARRGISKAGGPRHPGAAAPGGGDAGSQRAGLLDGSGQSAGSPSARNDMAQF